jgi:uncharacterized membrane protein
MINTLQKIIKRSRYKIAIFGLMAFASMMCILLVAARIAYSDTGRYTGLVWNFVLPITAILWLLFFPNAPYILTDLQHLTKETSSAPVWYDVIVMVWFSWTGLLLGLVSLYLMHDIVQRTFGRWFGWAFVFIVSGLSSFGVYLGRFVRFNSWDLLGDPKEIVVTILGLAIDPSRRLVAFTILFAVFYLFVYLTLYSFAHLLQEQSAPSAIPE